MIEKILSFKENADYKRLSVDEIVILKDYITNLQEENERLSRTITDYDELLMQKNNIIDKARELISKKFLCYDNESDEYIQGKRAINILNGGDE